MLSKQQIQKLNNILQKQLVQKFGVLAVALLVIGAVSFFGFKQNQASHAAGVGVLTMSPATSSTVVGQNVTVTLSADSGTDPVNAVQASVTYDATKLQFVSVTEGTAFPTVAATSTTTAGIVRIARGSLAGQAVTGNNVLATVTFKVLGNSGTTPVAFDPAFSYIVRSTDNANILTTVTGSSVSMKLPAPTVSVTAPVSGPTAGGTILTLTGTNFVAGATVSVGGTPATLVNVVSATSLTATAPAHAAGLVSVVVTNPDGQSASQANAYTYIAPNPALTSIAPTSGLTTGGTAITLNGSNLSAPSSVTIGGVAATSVTLVSSTQITAIAPANTAGAKSVVVSFANQATPVTLTNAYTYTIPAPTVSTVAPASGPVAGGTTITVTGTNFVNVTSVSVGGTAATGVAVVNGTTLTAVTPAHAAGVVNVAVTTSTGSANKAASFAYTNPAPAVSSISPTSGTSSGGTIVTISGTNFLSGATVSFGATAATSVTFVSANLIRATAPAGTGAASVLVRNPDNQTATLAAAYTYLALGDANNDGRVNAIDLSMMISNDGQNYPPADFNGDGTVGSADLAILLGRWTW